MTAGERGGCGRRQGGWWHGLITIILTMIITIITIIFIIVTTIIVGCYTFQNILIG